MLPVTLPVYYCRMSHNVNTLKVTTQILILYVVNETLNA